MNSLQKLRSAANELGILANSNRPFDEYPCRQPLPEAQPPNGATTVVFLAQSACPLQEMGGGEDLGFDRTPARLKVRRSVQSTDAGSTDSGGNGPSCDDPSLRA